LGDWAQAYLDHAKARFVEQTFREKLAVFKRLFSEIAPTTNVQDLSKGMVLRHLTKQKELRSGYASNKDRKNLVAAWNWGIYYMDPPLPASNPCLSLKMPEEREPRYVPPEEDFWRVFDAAEGQDRVMLMAFLHLAARRKEVFGLRWEDVDFENLRVRLWTRKRRNGNTEADVLPMSGELKRALLWWRDNTPFPDEGHVFLSLDDTPFCREYRGKPFLKRTQFMRRLCETAGVKRFGFHAIRHLSASILYKSGYDVATIQVILRHQSPNTTTRYLRTLGLEDVRGAVEQFSRLGPGKVKELRDGVPEEGRENG
jgi:integrase